jgi:hypothetical protein
VGVPNCVRTASASAGDMKRSFSMAPPPAGAAVTSTAATMRAATAPAVRPRGGRATSVARRLRRHTARAAESGAAATECERARGAAAGAQHAAVGAVARIAATLER